MTRFPSSAGSMWHFGCSLTQGVVGLDNFSLAGRCRLVALSLAKSEPDHTHFVIPAIPILRAINVLPRMHRRRFCRRLIILFRSIYLPYLYSPSLMTDITISLTTPVPLHFNHCIQHTDGQLQSYYTESCSSKIIQVVA